jgi:hypothetical protein
MNAAPPSWRLMTKRMLRIVQCVEHVEVAFAGHAEGGVHAVDLECVDQDLAAAAGGVRHGEGHPYRRSIRAF